MALSRASPFMVICKIETDSSSSGVHISALQRWVKLLRLQRSKFDRLFFMIFENDCWFFKRYEVRARNRHRVQEHRLRLICSLQEQKVKIRKTCKAQVVLSKCALQEALEVNNRQTCLNPPSSVTWLRLGSPVTSRWRLPCCHVHVARTRWGLWMRNERLSPKFEAGAAAEKEPSFDLGFEKDCVIWTPNTTIAATDYCQQFNHWQQKHVQRNRRRSCFKTMQLPKLPGWSARSCRMWDGGGDAAPFVKQSWSPLIGLPLFAAHDQEAMRRPGRPQKWPQQFLSRKGFRSSHKRWKQEVETGGDHFRD